MSSARLLILGVLRTKQPTHGYDIRKELEVWGAEGWANIAYGSIYHALSSMTKEELVEPVDTAPETGKRPAKTAYAITESGEREFQRLLREHWWEQKPAIDPFHVALTFMDALPRDELVTALRHHAAISRANAEVVAHFSTKLPLHEKNAPRHIADIYRLVAAHLEVEANWSEDAAEKAERGELP